MIIALIDNGSLQPAAHRQLRSVATALWERTGVTVHAVSWKHSDRVPAAALDGVPAWTLAPFVRAQIGRGESEFVFVPFFISPQGAIGSALRDDLETLRDESGQFKFTFTESLATRGAIPAIVASRVRETLAVNHPLFRVPPPVVIVDHGGPSAVSGALRDTLAAQIQEELCDEFGPIAAASMEGAYGPLLAEQLAAQNIAGHDVIVAPLFLSPGRHAGPDGDLARICQASPVRCHLTGLVGDHPAVVDVLAAALRDALSTRTANSSGSLRRAGLSGLLFADPLVNPALEAADVSVTK